MLAIVAMLGPAVLSGWHTATIHDDDAVHVTAVDHRHDSPGHADPDDAVHLLAHATGQSVALAAPFAAPAPMPTVGDTWSGVSAPFRSGIDPSQLLRPPRG